jgi:hypothetical protein
MSKQSPCGQSRCGEIRAPVPRTRQEQVRCLAFAAGGQRPADDVPARSPKASRAAVLQESRLCTQAELDGLSDTTIQCSNHEPPAALAAGFCPTETAASSTRRIKATASRRLAEWRRRSTGRRRRFRHRRVHAYACGPHRLAREAAQLVLWCGQVSIRAVRHGGLAFGEYNVGRDGRRNCFYAVVVWRSGGRARVAWRRC